MICISCKKKLPCEDFLHSKKCYKCEYRDRSEALNPTVPKKEIIKCLICEKVISNSRRKYCSNECASIGKIKSDRNLWYRQMITDQCDKRSFKW